MNTLERRMKRIEDLTKKLKPPRKVQVIMFCPDEETEEEAFAKYTFS